MDAFPLLTRACGGSIRPEAILALQAELDEFLAGMRELLAPATPEQIAEREAEAAARGPITVYILPDLEHDDRNDPFGRRLKWGGEPGDEGEDA
jgi:hypothetical protein